MDVSLWIGEQNVVLKTRLRPLVHLNTMVVVKHECYIDVWSFMYCSFVWEYWTEYGSWMAGGRTIEWFEDLVVVVVWGGSPGCELPQSCGLRGHVWLILLSCAMKCINVLCVNPFSPQSAMWLILEILDVFKKNRTFRKLVLYAWECF